MFMFIVFTHKHGVVHKWNYALPKLYYKSNICMIITKSIIHVMNTQHIDVFHIKSYLNNAFSKTIYFQLNISDKEQQCQISIRHAVTI